jgi:hypothetical protein
MRNYLAAADWWPVSRLPAADLPAMGSPAELELNPPRLMPHQQPVEPAPAESPSGRSTGRAMLELVVELCYRRSSHLPEPAPKSKLLPPAGNSHLERHQRAADY